MEVRSNTKFCHFTSTDNARSILNSESFFLSKYDRMNDLAEASLHDEQRNRVFVLCFSNSDALNIPAFYLYGGIDGKGCRIQFTDAKMREIINHCSLFYVNNKLKRLKKEISKSDYNIYYDWIYYISSDGYCEHKKDKAKRYSDLNEAFTELEKNNRHFFIKSPIWKYENEFRIVVVFNKEIKYNNIALNFPMRDIDKSISVAFGPETTDEEFSELSDEFQEYGIVNSMRTSDYAISMNLIARNKRLLKRV